MDEVEKFVLKEYEMQTFVAPFDCYEGSKVSSCL